MSTQKFGVSYRRKCDLSMATLKDYGFDDILKNFDKIIYNTSDMAIMAVDEAAPIVEKSFKNHIDSAANRGYATGALKNSVVTQKAKENQYGVFSVVKVTGTAASGIPRTDQLRYLEFGTKRQQPHPVRAPTIAECAVKVQEIMKKSMENQILKQWEGG